MSKDAFYFSHDSNARNDPKLVAIRNKWGWSGVGLYWGIVEVLRDQPKYEWPHSPLIGGYDGLALAIGYNDELDFHAAQGLTFDMFVEDCIKVGLFSKGEHGISSGSLITRMEQRNLFREKGKEGAKKRWMAHANSPLLADTNSPPMALKERKGKESKGKEINRSIVRSEKRTHSPKGAALSDDDFINELKNNGAYKNIDIDRELAKMDAWLLTPKGRRRQKTRRFVVSWLNKIDVPLEGQSSKGNEYLRKVLS